MQTGLEKEEEQEIMSVIFQNRSAKKTARIQSGSAKINGVLGGHLETLWGGLTQNGGFETYTLGGSFQLLRLLLQTVLA